MRTKQEDFAIEGPGVGRVKHKDLEQLGDQLSDLREKKAELAAEITQVEAEALAKMEELGLTRYRFRDREMSIKPGNPHVRIVEVEVGNTNGSAEADEA